MGRRHDRGAVRFAAQVIRASTLSDEELELQLTSVWKSGYLAGRKAVVQAALVEKGVEFLRRERQKANGASSSSSTVRHVGKVGKYASETNPFEKIK